MDYRERIDAETWAFIEKVRSFAPPDAGNATVAEQRAAYDALCHAFAVPYPEGVAARNATADGVAVRIYSAGQPNRTVIWFHGGGFVVGGLDSHDDLCAEICACTGFRVVAVDYRLAPDHPHPAAFEDCWTATRWVTREYGAGVVLAGDSAGGTLAAAVAHHARGRLEGILGQVLVYPWLGDDMDGGSHVEHADAPCLTRADMLFYRQARLGGLPAPVDDPTYAPLSDTDFSGLPPTVIFVAECDPLRDDGIAYYENLRAAGCRAHLVEEPGLVHGYLRARHSVQRAAASFERIETAIEALGQGLWPWD
ncbi:alpha/beta hydrolase [Jhaorihella thermophila]|uniref:Acetyl esterase n=1 Tax=Jhaorihella thermophila TaxID=488547 RepID=A0A1H5Z1I5_9RHOB|nr:alpha/beta hydrolase [Jhaorihella thermophila]SEG30459.1 acetyl esterase [Jhaorihella thermophila]